MADIVFDPDKGVIVPSTEDMREDTVQKMQESFQRTPEEPKLNCEPSSPMGQVTDLVVAEKEAKNTQLLFVVNNFNINTATGVYLDMLVAFCGVERKIAEPTVVDVTITGLKGTTLPFGVIAQDTNGNKYTHSVVAGVTIDESGTANTIFESVEQGAILCQAGSLNQIVTTVAGWDSITNVNAGATGRDEETDAELRERYKKSYAMNANGTRENLEAQLSELDGVLDCRVLENYTGDYLTLYGLRLDSHSIGVCIVGGDDEKIAETIYKRKDAGCGTTGDYRVSYSDPEHSNAKYTYKITRPENETLKIRITFYEELISDDLAQAIKQAIVNDVLGEGSNARVQMASTVYSSRFYPVILTETELPVKSISLQLGDGEEGQQIDIPATSEPVITTDDVTLEFGG